MTPSLEWPHVQVVHDEPLQELATTDVAPYPSPSLRIPKTVSVSPWLSSTTESVVLSVFTPPV